MQKASVRVIDNGSRRMVEKKGDINDQVGDDICLTCAPETELMQTCAL